MQSASDLAPTVVPSLVSLENEPFGEAQRSEFAARGHSGVYRHPLLQGTTLGDRAIAGYQAYAKDTGFAFPGATHVDMEKKLDAGLLWFQSAFAVVPEIYELASHPSILEPVKAILGPDLVLWAATLLSKPPGAIHCWHTDTTLWETVGAFVGLRGITQGSVLRLISGSHRWGMGPYEIFTNGHFGEILTESMLADDRLVLAEAQKRDPRARIYEPEMKPGDFFLFDGLTWHGSRNTSDQHRMAMTFFYARPDANIQIPTTFGKIPAWYRENPPCVLVSGVDRFRKTNLVPPPPPRAPHG